MEESRQLKPIFFSEKIPGDTFTATRAVLDASPRLVRKIKEALMAMGESKAGHTILKDLYNIDSLLEAVSEDYEPVRSAFRSVRQRRG